jgi:urea transport system ATP-binding protein
LISISNVNQVYGGTQVLWDLDMEIESGSVTCVMGRNGVGKTTLLKCLMGLLPVRSGQILYQGHNLVRQNAEFRARNGIGYVPQGRDIFPLLTVEENLKVALGSRPDGSKQIPERIFELFPVLAEMMSRRGGDLSGGQQQQLAIGRALVLDPTVMILDEPNEGIQPNIVHQIGDVILKLNVEEGLTVILVEQKLNFARRVGQHFHLMEKGRVVASGAMSELSEELVNRHLAV